MSKTICILDFPFRINFSSTEPFHEYPECVSRIIERKLDENKHTRKKEQKLSPILLGKVTFLIKINYIIYYIIYEFLYMNYYL